MNNHSAVSKIILFTAFSFLMISRSTPQKTNTIAWYIKNPPIIFENDAVLVCNASNVENCCSNTVTWMRDYDVIIHHGISANISKYEHNHVKDGFYLTIKAFDEMDLNHQYTCLYDFYAFSRIIEMNNQTDFQLIPSPKDIQANIRLTEQTAIATLIFYKVYPLPTCNMKFNGSDIPSSMNVTNVSNGLFYSATVYVVCKMNSTLCDGDIAVNCLIGQNKIVIDEKKRTECKFTNNNEIEEKAWSTWWTVFLIAVCVVGIIICIILRKKTTHSCLSDLEGGMHEVSRDHELTTCDKEETTPLLKSKSVMLDDNMDHVMSTCDIEETTRLHRLQRKVEDLLRKYVIIPAQKCKDVLNIIAFTVLHDLYHQMSIIRIQHDRFKKRMTEICSFSWFDAMRSCLKQSHTEQPANYKCKNPGANFGSHITKTFEILCNLHDQEIKCGNKMMSQVQHLKYVFTSGVYDKFKKFSFPGQISKDVRRIVGFDKAYDIHYYNILGSNSRINDSRSAKQIEEVSALSWRIAEHNLMSSNRSVFDPTDEKKIVCIIPSIRRKMTKKRDKFVFVCDLHQCKIQETNMMISEAMCLKSKMYLYTT